MMESDRSFHVTGFNGIEGPDAYEHSIVNMESPYFLNHLAMQSHDGEHSYALKSAYGISKEAAWPVLFEDLGYGPVFHNPTASFATSPCSEMTSFPIGSPQVPGHPISPLDGVPIMKTTGEPPTNTKDVNGAIFPRESGPQASEKGPKLRSVNTKRRCRPKHASPDADDSSDNDLKPRPAHNKAERNYRRRLNSSFEKLLEVMNLVAPQDPNNPHDAEVSRELSKGDVLRLARQQLVNLEMENRRLREELENVRVRPQRSISWSGLVPGG